MVIHRLLTSSESFSTVHQVDSVIFWSVLGLSLACLCFNFAFAAISYRSAQKVRHAHRIADELAELADSVQLLRSLFKRVDARTRRRDEREDAANPDGMPDPKSEPAEWLKAKQRQLMTLRKN